MSHAADQLGPLVEENQRAHDAIEDALLDVLESVTALKMTSALERWARFLDRLDAHIAFEEREIFPAYAELSDHPRGGGPELFDGDHVTLRKVIAACRTALEEITDTVTDQRRLMVTRLGPLLRLRNVLEHHDLREQRFLYPRLETHLDAETCSKLTDGLRASNRLGQS